MERLQGDIIFLSETKTRKHTCALIDGYVTIYNNRKIIHKKAESGSGGTAFLLKKELYERYKVTREDMNVDGLIMLRLKHKLSNHTMSILSPDLPPESSTHCDDPDTYFQKLLSFIYEFYDDDVILMCGDYNARVGQKCDYVETIDELPSRSVIDTTCNDHGISPINFCVQSKMCIINGRISPLNDGFTSV